MAPGSSLDRVLRAASTATGPGRRVAARLRAGRAARLPALRVAGSGSDRPRTVWVVTPDWDRPSGGIRKLYRTVDVLNAAGLSSAVVHTRAGFRCSWFTHTTRITSADEVAVEPGDVIVVPEIYGPAIAGLPSGVGHVVLNQNVYVTIDSLVSRGPAAAAPYRARDDLLAVAVVSQENLDTVRYLFPDVAAARIRWAIDEELYHPPDRPAGPRMAYMSRRRADEAAQVLALLELRAVTAGWDVVAIDKLTERAVADVLRSCSLFLSFSDREGLGLPPLEAIACGCLVVGFDGFAGREFFRAPHATRVENGDVVGFARAVEAIAAGVQADPAGSWRDALAGSRGVRTQYSVEAERADLLALFGPLVTIG